MRWMVRPLAICVLVGIPALAAAQSSSVAGRVTDATGSALPGVTVTLTAPTIIGTRTEVTDGTGSYRFEVQSPGTHTLKFELAGFKTLVRDEVIVSAGRTTTVNALIEVGELAETVTVTGASPVVDLENAAVGVNFTADMLQSAPNARDIWAVLAQTPGVTMQRYDVGGSGAGSQSPYRSYGFSGQTYILMDGMNVTEGTSGAGWFYTDYGMFSEIQIVSASKGADVPNAGTFINQVVRSGSNAFHGEFYTDYNNENFQGDNINDELRALGVTVGDKIERYNDVNGQVGGPVLKDKLWFFYSGRRQYSGLQTIGFTRADNGQPATFYTILTNNTWKFNSRLGSNDLSYLGGYHYKFQPHRGGGTGQGGEGRFFTTASTGEQRQPTPIAAIRWTNTSLANAFTDVSVNWGKQDWGIERHQEDIDGSGPEANTVSRRDLTTRLVRGGYSGVITGNAVDSRTVPFRQIRPRLQISPSVTHYTDRLWTGSHAIKAGYVFNWEEFENPRLGNVEHLIEYYRDNFQTPDSIDTYNSPLNTFNRFRQHSFFVNDRWTAGKWTLNLGVRYDRYTNYYPAQGNTGEGPFSERIDVPARTLPAVGGFVPRFSAIYDFFGNGRTAIKASAGRYIFNPGTSLAENVNPNALVQRRYRWDGTKSWPSRGSPFVARPEDLVLTISGRQLDIHPDFEVGYT
ncbi:MAG: TonB-dependent receptor, partial [Acidobacteria bacterium]|nr:TonB-dependent receptor [Acidobacteriota bacterium]